MTFTSDKPVTVITGTSWMSIPYDICNYDHIVEQMIQIKSFDNIYIEPHTPPKEAYELKVTHYNYNYILSKTCIQTVKN